MIDTGTVGELQEVILYVEDVNRQVAFYRDTLGLSVKNPEGALDFRDFYRVELYTGSCTLVLQSSKKRYREDNAARLVFRVDDINARRATLCAGGVFMGEIRSPEMDIFICDGKDPEGNSFSIESRIDSPFNPQRVTTTAGWSPTYVTIDSRRGRSITLLRDNKVFIAVEVTLVITLLCLLPYLKFVSLISILLPIMLLLWLSGNNWNKLGMARPRSWKKTILIGLISGLLFTCWQIFITGPIIISLVHTRPNLQVFATVRHNTFFFIGTLVTSWTSAAFGEEMIFRGYLMNRLAQLFGQNFPGWTLACVIQAVVFASGHSYQGTAGMLVAGVAGFILGLLYLASKRNLWFCAIVHGINDTFAFLVTFIGL